MTTAVQVSDLTKTFGTLTAVDRISFTIEQGEIFGLLGPNGAGKTTSFYMVVGVIRPDAGQILFRGEDITNLPMFERARLGIGYLSQEPSIFRKLTVEENIMAILETLEIPQEERDRRLKRLLNDLNIAYLAKNKAYTLSGGERRRLEITRALVTNPALILLDEPFSGVDPLAVHDIQEIIKGLRSRGLGIIVTDHNVRETLSIVDRAYLLYDGQILCEGPSDFLVQDETARRLYLGKNFRM